MDGSAHEPARSLKGASIICIASANWDAELWTNSQHLMSRLARENRVLFVESLGLRRPRARWRDLQRTAGRIRNWSRGVRRPAGNLLVYSPLILPFHNVRWARDLNFWILRTSLSRIAKREKLIRPILWTFLPTSSDLVGHLGESLAIYHCVDEYGANPGVPADVIHRMEKDLLESADLVFTTSRSLYEGKSRFNPRTHYLPNVADAAHFHRAADAETEVPEELRALRRPVIGFVGALSDYKVDFDILLHMTRVHPEWSIALVGPIWAGTGPKKADELRRAPNVRLFGARPYAELPGLLKGFDVCIIPFLVNETTVNVFPMKFHEYMAAGKPIVVSDLPSIAEFRRYCRTARGPEAFTRAVEEALGEEPEGAAAERIAVARRNTWETRLEEIASIVDGERRAVRAGRKPVPRGRIGIDGRKMHDFGIGTYIRNLVRELSRIDPEREYVLFQYSSERVPWGGNIRIVEDNSPKYSLREHLFLPLRMQKCRIDLFHSPHYVLPIARPCRAVVTIHDLIHLFHPPSKAAWAYAQMMMHAATRSASRVITVSEASRADIVRVLGVDPEKVVVVRNAVDERFVPGDPGRAREEVARTIGLEEEYVLCVSNSLPHKNLARLVEAFAALKRRGYGGHLVLAGVPPERARPLCAAARRLHVEPWVRFPGFVPGSFLPVLYGGAKLFVFPSLYEGFGLPPLEAMACGVPVVVSDVPALREVVGDAGVRVDPLSVSSIEGGMRALLEDPALHKRFAEEGLRHVRGFSWREAAEQTLRVYEEVIGHG